MRYLGAASRLSSDASSARRTHPSVDLQQSRATTHSNTENTAHSSEVAGEITGPQHKRERYQQRHIRHNYCKGDARDDRRRTRRRPQRDVVVLVTMLAVHGSRTVTNTSESGTRGTDPRSPAPDAVPEQTASSGARGAASHRIVVAERSGVTRACARAAHTQGPADATPRRAADTHYCPPAIDCHVRTTLPGGCCGRGRPFFHPRCQPLPPPWPPLTN